MSQRKRKKNHKASLRVKMRNKARIINKNKAENKKVMDLKKIPHLVRVKARCPLSNQTNRSR